MSAKHEEDMAKITHRYDLPDYAAFMNMGFDLKLPDDVIKSVSGLADLVGAPTYIKTPVFPVRDPSDFRNGSQHIGGGSGNGGYHVAGSSANTFQSRFGNGGGAIASGGSGSTDTSHSFGHTITRQSASFEISKSRIVNGIQFCRFRRLS